MTSSARIRAVTARLGSGAWWLRSSDGRLVVGQFPNPALAVWLGALVWGRLGAPAADAAALDGVRFGALFVWALDELLRGASPFRRLLGAVVLAGQLVPLLG